MPERDSYTPGTPCWVDLGTSDEEASTRFYTDLFGWDADPLPTPDGRRYVMLLQDGLEVAALMQFTEEQMEQGPPSMWTTYLAADGVEAATERVAEAGGTIVLPATDIPESGRMAVVGDPTGAMFGLWEAGGHIGARLVNEPNSLAWNDVATTDLDAATEFYVAVFGYDTEDEPLGEDEDAGVFRAFLVDGQPIGGAYELSADMNVPPFWSVTFSVEDTDAMAERASELGATVVREPQDSPYGRMAVIADPLGATFNVIDGSAEE